MNQESLFWGGDKTRMMDVLGQEHTHKTIRSGMKWGTLSSCCCCCLISCIVIAYIIKTKTEKFSCGEIEKKREIVPPGNQNATVFRPGLDQVVFPREVNAPVPQGEQEMYPTIPQGFEE